jgi:glycosyltransferase involved in cell wall biosynthesis
VRLLLAITELALGGAERVVVELDRGASEAGHDVSVAAAAGPLDQSVGRFLELPSAARSPIALARIGGRLARIVRTQTPELVHSHNPRMTAVAAGAVRAAARRPRPPVLATYHGAPPARAAAAARLLRLADHIVCVSSDLADELAAAGVPPAKVSTVLNGVPASRGLDSEARARLEEELRLDDAPVVTAVGRLVPQKAHHRLVDAARAVHAQLPSARFLVVGDGPLRGEIEARVRAAGLDGVVTLTGPRRDAREIIARSDLVAFSSDWEGLSVAALEALAEGVPVVSTDVAGAAELVDAGAAVVVPRSADALAGAILDLLGNPGRREEIGSTGRRLHAERFATGRMVERYLELYERLRPPPG